MKDPDQVTEEPLAEMREKWKEGVQGERKRGARKGLREGEWGQGPVPKGL